MIKLPIFQNFHECINNKEARKEGTEEEKSEKKEAKIPYGVWTSLKNI